MQSENRLWKTPGGSNDDWYWLYGAASQCEKGILVSNDKLRDHVFDLLRPRFFLKWKNNQIWKYDVTTHDDWSVTAEIHPPPLFTNCVQKIEESGAWMFPIAGEECEEGEAAQDSRTEHQTPTKWLCARPSV